MCLCIRACVCAYMRACVRACVCACVRECVRAWCVWVWVWVWVWVCVCVRSTRVISSHEVSGCEDIYIAHAW